MENSNEIIVSVNRTLGNKLEKSVDRAKGSSIALSLNENGKLRRFSVGESKLNDIIDNLNDNTLEKEAFGDQNIQVNNEITCIQKSREIIVYVMEQPTFHYGVVSLIILDLIIVFIELIIGKSRFYFTVQHQIYFYH